ncbi:MAG: hypothetical protein HY241_09665 [Actinobacteria bacterium]|nr:hypothetical protein [Actinomycetota bacterium]
MHNDYVSIAARVSGHLDLPRLDRAWRRVQARHAVLLSGFDLGSQQWLPARAEPGGLLLFDLSGDRPAGSEADPSTVLADALHTPLSVAAGPLARLCVVTESETSHLVGLAVEHLVCDGWTVGLLESELWQAYPNPSERVNLSEPETTRAADFRALVIEQHRYLASDSGRSALDRRCRALQDVGPLPTLDMPAPAADPLQGHRPRHVSIALDEVRFGALRDRGSRFGLSVIGVTLAAILAATQELTGASRVGAGMILANRADPEVRQTVGWLSDEIVATCDCACAPSSEQFLSRFAAGFADAVDASRVPSRAVVARMAPELMGVPGKLPRIVYNPMPSSLRGMFPPPEVQGLSVTRLTMPESWAGNEIHVLASDSRSLVLRMFYKPRAVDPDLMRELRDGVRDRLGRWAC